MFVRGPGFSTCLLVIGSSSHIGINISDRGFSSTTTNGQVFRFTSGCGPLTVVGNNRFLSANNANGNTHPVKLACSFKGYM